MPAISPFEVSFKNEQTLTVRVSMTGPQHVFKSGKRGYTFRESFDWNGASWRLRFQAFAGAGTTITTLGTIKEPEPGHQTTSDEHFGSLMQIIRASHERKAAGWKLEKQPDGFRGWFDMTKVRMLPSKKTGSFASFDIEIGGVAYFGEFHLVEDAAPRPTPTAWDWSRGAKAGLPTLGKRR